MENMDKEHTVPKWGLIVWPKIPKMPQSLSAQFVCPSPKVLNIIGKRLHRVSIARGLKALFKNFNVMLNQLQTFILKS